MRRAVGAIACEHRCPESDSRIRRRPIQDCRIQDGYAKSIAEPQSRRRPVLGTVNGFARA
jgi:hypothetical protein